MNNTLEFLYSLRNQGSRFGLERMEAFCQELGNPQFAYPSIHVAGTNGKGSVCAMLDSVYREQGYRVGQFTSPHLIELGERVRVNGEILSFAKIEKWVEALLPVVQKIETSEQGMGPTFFEFMTAIAFLEFKEQKVDLAIVETGLGGRLDSTNVLNPEISVITSIGYDHCDMLGYELKKIAAEKAGIIKPGKPVVTGWLEEDAREQVRQMAQNQKAPLHWVEDANLPALPQTNLHGSFQQRNAALASRVVQLLDSQFPCEEHKVSSALQSVRFPGRWQKICTEPTIILDACHNGHGAQASAELWDRLPEGFEVWFAACGQDRARDVLTPLLQRTNRITLFELDQPRACSLEDLQKLVENFPGAVKFAKEKQVLALHQQLDPSTTLLVTGSIYLIAAVLSQLKKNPSSALLHNWQDLW